MAAITDVTAQMLLYNPKLLDSPVLETAARLDQKCLVLIEELHRISTTSRAFKTKPQLHEAVQGTCLGLCARGDLTLNQLKTKLTSTALGWLCKHPSCTSETTITSLQDVLSARCTLLFCQQPHHLVQLTAQEIRVPSGAELADACGLIEAALAQDQPLPRWSRSSAYEHPSVLAKEWHTRLRAELALALLWQSKPNEARPHAQRAMEHPDVLLPSELTVLARLDSNISLSASTLPSIEQLFDCDLEVQMDDYPIEYELHPELSPHLLPELHQHATSFQMSTFVEDLKALVECITGKSKQLYNDVKAWLLSTTMRDTTTLRYFLVAVLVTLPETMDLVTSQFPFVNAAEACASLMSTTLAMDDKQLSLNIAFDTCCRLADLDDSFSTQISLCHLALLRQDLGHAQCAGQRAATALDVAFRLGESASQIRTNLTQLAKLKLQIAASNQDLFAACVWSQYADLPDYSIIADQLKLMQEHQHVKFQDFLRQANRYAKLLWQSGLIETLAMHAVLPDSVRPLQQKMHDDNIAGLLNGVLRATQELKQE
eukprot:TRINITY_DN8238_c0_g1_i3.p1 TRINITY_DN8238_c0_g1~~TRINITY_DN8238_c0_g1_i3.p1  ORF type:complete len:544 (+),score=90.07 TRINITY_DN8238_c0_g1_i3:91-1722(+)